MNVQLYFINCEMSLIALDKIFAHETHEIYEIFIGFYFRIFRVFRGQNLNKVSN